MTLAGQAATVITLDDAASDSATRDTIQAALSLVAANATGGDVVLSAGTFVVAALGDAGDGALRVGSNTTFAGAGIGLTTIKLGNNPGHDVTGIVRTDSGKANPDGSLRGTHDVTIQGLSIDGNSGNTGSFAVDGFFSGPKPFTLTAIDDNIHLNSVEIYGVSRYGFDPHEGTANLTLTSCVAHHNGQDGFTIDAVVNATITGSEAYANGRHGFNIVTSSRDVQLSGNLSHGNAGAGIVVQTGNFETRALTANVEIKGGNVSDNGGDGIVVRQANGVTIGGTAPGDGVTINGNARFGLLIEGGQSIDVVGNSVFDNLGGTGSDNTEIRVRGYAQTYLDTDPLNDVFVLSSAVTLSGNSIGSVAVPHSYAVSYSDAGTPLISSNTLTGIAQISVADTSKRGGMALFVEQITTGDDAITGSAGRDSITGDSGNDSIASGAGDDVLYGADGNDTLDGGIGNDTMYGGFGDDTFVVDATDLVVELARGGTDLVITSLSAFSLALSEIENLTYNGLGNFSGTGSAAGNIITGGNGNDVLDGGAGADTLRGGLGNDLYIIDSAADVIVETGGIDSISTRLQTVLAEGIEKLFLDGGANVNGTGNSANNVLVGNTGANTLTGLAGADAIYGQGGNDWLLGGRGRDVLSGGAGSDVFVFDTRGLQSIDRIADFASAWDTMVIENAVFSSIKGLGVMTAAQFFQGAGAHDVSDRLIYNPKTGVLVYDANGNRPGAAGVVAVLEKGLALSHLDFYIV